MPTTPPSPALSDSGAPQRRGEDRRLELEDSLIALIEWSAASRGMDPKVWLTLAVAAYHESGA